MGSVLNERLKQRPSNDPRLDALLNLKLVTHLLKTMEAGAYEPYGLSIAQFNVLRILKGVHPDGHPRYEVISRMVEPAPDITRIIDRLVKKGLVKRDRTGVDRRLAIHRITPRGLALVERATATKEQFLGHIGARLTAAECEHLSLLCERLYAQSK